MITKEQAMVLQHGEELHYTGNGSCAIQVGPRGGEKEGIIRVRVSGKCQTWKRDTSRFRLPVKYGLYESSEVNQSNAALFHLPEDCKPKRQSPGNPKKPTRGTRPYYPAYGIV